MVCNRIFAVLLSTLPLAIAASAMAAPAPATDLPRQIAAAESLLRDRLAVDPSRAPQVRVALARLEALGSGVAAIRHVQGGVLSADQQARIVARLAAIDPATIATPRTHPVR